MKSRNPKSSRRIPINVETRLVGDVFICVCGKRAYSSITDAKIAIEFFKRNRTRNEFQAERYYECLKVKNAWHITSKQY